MSNRKTRRQKIRSQQRQLEKRKELKELKQQAIELEKQIEIQKKINLKEKRIKNLRIFGSVCSFSAPFVLAAGISVGILKVAGMGFPLVKDDVTKYKRYFLEYSTDGKIEANQYYDTSETISGNILKIYSPWALEDGLYKRTLREYSVDDLTDAKLYYAILEQNVEYIKKVFDNYKEEQEFSNKVEKEYNGYIIEAKVDMFDKSDILIVEESDSINLCTTIINLLATLVGGGIMAYKRDFRLNSTIEDIRDIYECNTNPIEPLKEQLKEKREKILTLSRGGKKCDR